MIDVTRPPMNGSLLSASSKPKVKKAKMAWARGSSAGGGSESLIPGEIEPILLELRDTLYEVAVRDFQVRLAKMQVCPNLLLI